MRKVRRLPAHGKTAVIRWPAAGRRCAQIFVELLLTLPILCILLVGIVEFGIILSVTKHVAASSRFGAKLASVEPALGAFAPLLRSRIDDFLETAGIDTGACRVILEDNVSGATVQVDPADGCPCSTPTTPLPVTAGAEFVRVTVCVLLEDNVPDLLSSFGFSVGNRFVEHTTLFRHIP